MNNFDLILEMNFDLEEMAKTPFQFATIGDYIDYTSFPRDLFFFSKGLKNYFQGFKTTLNPEGRHYFAEITEFEFEITPMYSVDSNRIIGREMWYKRYLAGDWHIV